MGKKRPPKKPCGSHWLAILAGLTLIVLVGVGCGFLQRAADTDQEPSPLLNNRTPTTALLQEAPKVIVNPLDIPAWIQIAVALGILGLGGAGVYNAKKTREVVSQHTDIMDTIRSLVDTEPPTPSKL